MEASDEVMAIRGTLSGSFPSLAAALTTPAAVAGGTSVAIDWNKWIVVAIVAGAAAWFVSSKGRK